MGCDGGDLAKALAMVVTVSLNGIDFTMRQYDRNALNVHERSPLQKRPALVVE